MVKPPFNVSDAERRLAELVRHLEAYVDEFQPGDPAIDVLKWFIDGAKPKLLGIVTLDKALGLQQSSRGRPALKELPRNSPARKKLRNLAFDAHPHVVASKGRLMWKPIAAKIGFEGTANELRKIYKQHFNETEYLAREISRF